MFKDFKKSLGIVVLGLLLGTSIQFAYAWSNPTTPPPGGNLDGALTTGIINQIKRSSLGLTGNLSVGLIQLNTIVIEGSTCSSNGLLGRNSTGALLSCQSLVWKK
jgi:hypothetical protein